LTQNSRYNYDKPFMFMPGVKYTGFEPIKQVKIPITEKQRLNYTFLT